MRRYYINEGLETGKCGHLHCRVRGAAVCQHLEQRKDNKKSDRTLMVVENEKERLPTVQEARRYLNVIRAMDARTTSRTKE